MLKILLVDANSSWLLKDKSMQDLEQIIPPLGLMYIATIIKGRFSNKIEVKLINAVMDCPSNNDFSKIVEEFRPDLVGIRGLNIYKERFHQFAQISKRIKEDIIVIGGGPYPTMDTQSALRDKNVDYLVLGEAEDIFVIIVDSILSNHSFLDAPAIAYRLKDKLVINAAEKVTANLNSLPFPDYNLISVERYGNTISYGYNRRKQGLILTSRGCPYGCIYCHNMFGKEFRPRSAQNVFQEIKQLYDDFKIRDFYFIDDCFNLDYKRCIEIFDLIINSGIKVNLYLTNGIRGDIVDFTFVDKMIEAGVIWVTYALETASPRLQKFIKKFNDLDKLRKVIDYTCEKEIMTNCCFMVGFPTETKEEVLQTINYVKNFKKINIPMFFSVKYYPNTEIYDLAIKYGLDVDNIKYAYSETYHDIRHAQTPLIPKKEFRSIYFQFLKEVFLSKERLSNAIKIQKKFLTEQELLDVYSIFLRKRVRSLQEDIFRYAA